MADAVETAFAGHAGSKVLEGQASYDLVVRYSPEVLASIDSVAQTLITTTSGARLPLSALAEVRRDRGPNVISRENVQRKIVVMANAIQLIAAGALMAAGVWLHLTERHRHQHTRDALSHEHAHEHDAHHSHEPDEPVPAGVRHTHWHRHEPMTHTHEHFPDAHHRGRH